MSDYRVEYICLVSFLMSYDNEEKWDEILKECDLDFHEAIKVLKKRLQKKGGQFYKDSYEVVRRIYEKL